MRLPSLILSTALGAGIFATSAVATADEPASTTTLRSAPVVREPQPPRVRHNPTLFATGLALSIVGGAGVGVGAGFVLAGASHSCWNAPFCDPATEAKKPDDDALINGGIAIMILSAVMIATGVPMAIIGGKKEDAKSTWASSSPLAFRF